MSPGISSYISFDFIFGDKVDTYFNIFHVPLVSYPDSRDWSGLLYESAVNNYEFGDLVQAQISGGLNGNNIKHIINRLDQDQWPGWPSVSWKVVNPAFDKPNYDPDNPGDNTIEIDVETPEKLKRAFPGVPFREAGVDFDEPTFPHKKSDVRTYAANYGVDNSLTLTGLWSSLDEEQRQYVDNIHFSPLVRLWDVSEPAKHYLYEFYKLQWDAGMIGLVTAKPGEEGSGDGPPEPPDHDAPDENDPEDYKKYYLAKLKRLEAGENYPAYRTGVTVTAKGWEAYAGYSFLESGENRDTSSVGYQNMLGMNRTKTTSTGKYKEDFYVSSSDFLLSCGYIAWTQQQVITFLTNPSNATRAKPLVLDRSRNRNRLRVDTPVRIPSYISITNEEGIAERGGELIPGKLYERINSTSLQQITPGVAGSATPNEDIEVENITFYHVHKEGYDWVTVWFPRTGLFINDAETNVADRIVTFDINHVMAAAVPFFPDIVEDYNFYPKSDLFAVSWHISISISDVRITKFSPLKALLLVVTIVLLLWFPPLGASAWSIAAAGEAVFIMTAGLVISRVAYGIFADEPILAFLVMTAVAVATGNYKYILNIANVTAQQLPYLLVEFLTLLERTQKMLLHMDVKEYEDDVAYMEQQLEEYQEQMNEYAPAAGGTLDLPSLLFQEEEEEEDSLFYPFMVSADSFYKATDNYHNLGYDMLDADKFYDMALDTRVER